MYDVATPDVIAPQAGAITALTYSGGTGLNGGTLVVGNEANLGNVNGGLTFNGGTLQITGDLSGARLAAGQRADHREALAGDRREATNGFACVHGLEVS